MKKYAWYAMGKNNRNVDEHSIETLCVKQEIYFLLIQWLPSAVSIPGRFDVR